MKPPEAAVIQLIKLTVTEGKGTDEDVMRRVDYYYTLDGLLVVRVDEWEEEQRQAKP